MTHCKSWNFMSIPPKLVLRIYIGQISPSNSAQSVQRLNLRHLFDLRLERFKISSVIAPGQVGKFAHLPYQSLHPVSKSRKFSVHVSLHMWNWSQKAEDHIEELFNIISAIFISWTWSVPLPYTTPLQTGRTLLYQCMPEHMRECNETPGQSCDPGVVSKTCKISLVVLS